MAMTKTWRFDSNQVAWLAAESERTGLKENAIMRILIDQARKHGWSMTSEPEQVPS